MGEGRGEAAAFGAFLRLYLSRLGGGVVAPLAGKWRHGLGSGPGLGLRRQGQRAAARGLASVGGRPTHRRARAT